MAGITYRTSDDIDFELLDQLIQKAIFLDEHYKPTWKKK